MKDLMLFSEIAQAISAKPLREALAVVAEKAATMINANHCCCVVRNKEKKLVIKAGYPLGVHGVGQEISCESAAIMKEMEVTHQRSRIIINPAQNPKTACYLRGFAEYHHLSAVLFVALISKKELIGFLVFDFVKHAKKRIGIARILADFIASQIETMREKGREGEKARILQNISLLGEQALRAAHLIRNSLTNIGGHAHRLEKSMTLTDHDRLHAAIVAQEIIALGKDLNNMLLISDFSPENLYPEKRNVNGVFQNIVKRLRMLHPHHPIIFDPGETSGLFMMLNEDWVKNCVDDIVRNAIDAHASNIWIKMVVDEADENLLIFIENDGEVLDPTKINVRELADIFSPFFSTKGNGACLGLSTVQCMIQSHGGKITVESKAGNPDAENPAPCTTFKISLPL